MLSKTISPCVSDQPLGENTRCVAFPVLISVTDLSYAEALASARDVCRELELAAAKLQSESIQTSLSPIEEKVGSDTVVEFSQNGKDCIAEVFLCLSVRFDTEMSMWKKLDSISVFLDSIAGFSSRYKGHKRIRVAAGVSHAESKYA